MSDKLQIQMDVHTRCIFCGQFISNENIMGCDSPNNPLPPMTAGGKPHAIESKSFPASIYTADTHADHLAALAERDKEIERLKQPVTDQWQPMETAPRDGTRILVDFGNCHGVHAVAWGEAKGIDCWYVDDNKHGPWPLRGWIETDVRGWMPLPQAKDAIIASRAKEQA